MTSPSVTETHLSMHPHTSIVTVLHRQSHSCSYTAALIPKTLIYKSSSARCRMNEMKIDVHVSLLIRQNQSWCYLNAVCQLECQWHNLPASGRLITWLLTHSKLKRVMQSVLDNDAQGHWYRLTQLLSTVHSSEGWRAWNGNWSWRVRISPFSISFSHLCLCWDNSTLTATNYINI